jgi:hypothetical protein
MQVLQYQRKGPHLNTLQKYYIHAETTKNNYLNDDHTVIPNKIFEAIQRYRTAPLTPP